MKSWNCKFITWLQLQTFWSSSVARRIFHWFFFQKKKKIISTTSYLVAMAVNIFRSQNLGKAANESSYSLTNKEKLIDLYCSYIWEKGTYSFYWKQTSFICFFICLTLKLCLWRFPFSNHLILFTFTPDKWSPLTTNMQF